MSNVNPVYPSAIFTWTDRVDGVSLDLSEDINSVAADLISVENTIGTNPEIETTPPLGRPVTYASLSSRVSDAMNNTNLPVSFLFSNNQFMSSGTSGILNSYTASYDPYGMFNGTDITIPVNGWYIISSEQSWMWNSSGYVRHSMTLNGSSNQIAESLIDWAFSGNVIGTVFGGVQSQAISVSPVTPRWQQFGKRPRMTGVTFQGPLHIGDRISCYSENGTGIPSLQVTNLTLKVSCLKKISGTFISG